MLLAQRLLKSCQHPKSRVSDLGGSILSFRWCLHSLVINETFCRQALTSANDNQCHYKSFDHQSEELVTLLCHKTKFHHCPSAHVVVILTHCLCNAVTGSFATIGR